MQTHRVFLFFAGLCLLSWVQAAYADDNSYALTIKNHKFIPETLDVPADQKVKIVVSNDDPTPEEFESYELNREKVVDGNSKITVFVGPLDPGTYPFFGDFHKDLANGKIIAK